MEELKPCPFCGGEARLHFKKALEEPYLFEDENIISCRNCEAEIMHYGHGEVVVNALVEMWNTRALGWINVKDSLPDNGILVLVCNDLASFIAGYANGHFYDVFDGDILDLIECWQPLPKPMKES